MVPLFQCIDGPTYLKLTSCPACPNFCFRQPLTLVRPDRSHLSLGLWRRKIRAQSHCSLVS